MFGRMAAPGPSPDNHLAAQLRGLSGLTMGESEAVKAARNLVGFLRLLAEIDQSNTERSDDHAGDGSGHRVREAKGRADRVRQRRAFDDELYLSGIAIHSRLVGSGFRLTYPTRKVRETQFSLFHRCQRKAGPPATMRVRPQQM
jgi:hypothetical protein